MPIRSGGPRLEHPPSPILLLAMAAQSVGSLAVRGSWRPNIYAFTATNGVAVQRAWGCGPVGANPSASRTDAGGWRSWPMRTMLGLDWPGWWP